MLRVREFKYDTVISGASKKIIWEFFGISTYIYRNRNAINGGKFNLI